MTISQVEAILAKIPKVPIDSPDLIGMEMLSTDIAPNDAYGRIAILHMIQDCESGHRKLVWKLAEAPNGTLTLWTIPPEPEEY